MLTSSRLPWADARRPRTPEPHGLSLTLLAQLLACGILGWTVFALGVERLLPHVTATATNTATNTASWTTVGSRISGTLPPAVSAMPIDEGDPVVADSIHSIAKLSAKSTLAKSTSTLPSSSELQVAAAGLTVPNSQH